MSIAIGRSEIITGVILCVIMLATGGFIGWKLAKGSVAVTQFDEYKDAVDARVRLESKLADAEIALMVSQQEAADARDKKVVEYVTIYRDKIKDPAVAQCVRDSGLLDVYNASVSGAISRP